MDTFRALNVVANTPPSNLDLIEKFRFALCRCSLGFDLVPCEVKMNLLKTIFELINVIISKIKINILKN